MQLDTITLDLLYLGAAVLGVLLQLSSAGLVAFAVFDLIVSMSKVIRRG